MRKFSGTFTGIIARDNNFDLAVQHDNDSYPLVNALQDGSEELDGLVAQVKVRRGLVVRILWSQS